MKIFFYSLIFTFVIWVLLLIPPIVDAYICSGVNCTPPGNCKLKYRGVNYCCYNNSAVCNEEYEGLEGCRECGVPGQYECAYTSSSVTKHVTECSCGCTDGSCNLCPTPTPTLPPGSTCNYWCTNNPGECELLGCELREGTCSNGGDCCDCPEEPPPPPGPSCTIDISDVIIYGLGSTSETFPELSASNGSISEVLYTISSPSIAEVRPPNPNTNPPFEGEFRSLDLGETSYTGEATVRGSGGTATCEDNANLSVVNPDPWFQVIGGDAVAGGRSANLVSSIPQPCVDDTNGVCNPNFIRDNPLYHPGVPSAGGETNFGVGSPSSRLWNVKNSPYLGRELYSYAYFEKKIPPEVINDPDFNFDIKEVGGDFFNNKGVSYGGYYWFRFNSNDIGSRPSLSIIDPAVNLSNRRVVLFVDGNLVIKTKILTATPGTSGFYAIVSGNIVVDKEVGDDPRTAPESPDLEGVFFADGNFQTETKGENSDFQLHTRGAVSAGTFTLQRYLPNNALYPAEIFEFGPDLILGWPPALTGKNIIWRELAP